MCKKPSTRALATLFSSTAIKGGEVKKLRAAAATLSRLSPERNFRQLSRALRCSATWASTVAIAILFWLASSAWADAGDLMLRLDNPDPQPNDRFSVGLAVVGNNNVLIGASSDDTGAPTAGSAYLLDSATGTPLLTLNNPAPAFGDVFGYAVAARPNGDLVVGAHLDDAGARDSGSAYVFDGTTGDLLRSLRNPTAAIYDNFGQSIVAMPNGDLLISAPLDDVGAFNSGAAYLMDGDTGHLLRTFKSPVVTAFEQFGIALAATANGDVLIGASGSVEEGESSGSVYLFDGASGDHLLTVRNPATSSTGRFFHRSLAASPDGDIWVGGYVEGAGGAVYRFDGNTGDHLLTLDNPHPSGSAGFGFSLASLANGDLLVGAFASDIGAHKAGIAYLFDGATGELLLTLDNPTPDEAEYFGSAVAVMPDGRLLVGAQYADAAADGTGAVYVFEGTGSTPDLTPLSRWSFDENAGCLATDDAGLRDGDLQPSCPSNGPSWLPGKVGSALRFDGADDHVRVEGGPQHQPAHQPARLTVAAWVRPDVLGNWDTVLMNTSRGAWTDGYGLYYKANVGGMSFFVNRYSIRVSAPIDSGRWTHVAATYDETEMRIYIDGALVDTLAYSEPIRYPDTMAPLLIGKGQGNPNAYGWNGGIDEVQIFDRALDPEEILSLCGGLRGGCQDTVPQVSSTWTFDENMGCTAGDAVSAFDGVLGPSCTGNAPSWVLGQMGYALDFDGVDDVVTMPPGAGIQPEQLTVAAWVFPDTLGRWDTALMNASTGGWADGYGIYYHANTGINFFVNHYSHRVSAPLSPGDWTHVVGTYDGTEIKLYLDGVLVDSVAFSEPMDYPSPTTPLLIGKGAGGASSYGWDGRLDDVRLLDGALDATEIQAIYEQGLVD